jgi:hypothetical protein
MTAGCPYLAGCHPHHHAIIHGHGSIGGGLLFLLLAVIIWHRITDGEWG